MNTAELLNIAASICPDRTALVFEDARYTFSQLNERANRIANALLSLGVQNDDRIAVLQVNCHQNVEIYFATAKIGAIYVPLNFRSKQEELVFLLNNSGSKYLFLGSRYCDMVNEVKSKLASVLHMITIDKECQDFIYYENILSSGPSEEVFSEVNTNDITILMYTSGTTGFPKGVMLSHESFTAYVLENIIPAQTDVEEKNILTVPLYHIAGIQAMMAAIYGGRTLIMQRQFEAREWMALVMREKANRAMLVPTMLKQVMDHPEFGIFNLSSLKVITYGAAPMSLNIIQNALKLFPNVSFINAFGQTETASTITSLNPEDHLISGSEEERKKKLKRLTSIGRPMSDVEMKIIDEDGKEKKSGEIGEIVAKGPRVMTGYWHDDEKTEETIDHDGWLHTGDMGYVDEDGYFFLAGRKTDMIIRGGENISPEEVENVLQSHPSIQESAVIGIPDAEWGELPRAIVVLNPGSKITADEILEFCRQKLASYKRPRSVVFTDELPRNPIGKILKRILRKKYGKL